MHQSMASVPVLPFLGIFIRREFILHSQGSVRKREARERKKGKGKERSHFMYFKKKRI